jgi:hypothetical protein
MMTGITVQCARLRAQLGRHLVAASIIVGAAGMSACASAGVGARAQQYDASPTSVVIENNSWDRVTVYISRGDQLWRLGDVGALARTSWHIRSPDSSSGPSSSCFRAVVLPSGRSRTNQDCRTSAFAD